MNTELTWEEQQDIQEYDQWLAESQWEECMSREADALAKLEPQSAPQRLRIIKSKQWGKRIIYKAYLVTE